MPSIETHNGYPLWHYIPNRPAAIVFVVLFALMTALHGIRMVRHRMWFCIPFVTGGVFETIGYLGRVLAYDHTGELIPYVLQSVFLLLAPVFFAATLYMVLGRVVLYTLTTVNDAAHAHHSVHAVVAASSLSLLPPRWTTRVFVAADVVSFFIQAGGAGILVQARSASSSKTGQTVIVGGLVFQLVSFAVFVLSALVFDVRSRSRKRRQGASSSPAARNILAMLYATSLLVMLRNVVRAAEYAAGQDSYLLAHEWVIYVLDGAPMLAVMAVFAAGYPAALQHGQRGMQPVATRASDDVELAGGRKSNNRT
ncbi:RTA1 like protein [Sporothrix brasiliensis 5110]|uniref:RTA1 like protein n=1 Tax=Sporothrix brasiliensis 5110 TaxID=1398154 RepID=A0A0C2IWQ7_9PEZI|nr:RTA1 like protein [Sporothrix brasiliensis 5110]KIH91170.1 RTA1 like protein [Sporothrix brasiliensis 5110]